MRRNSFGTRLSAALALAALLPLGAWCADAAKGAKLTDKPVTYTLALSESANQPVKVDSPTIAEIERITGIKLKVISIPESDYGSKMNALYATNNLPDFFVLWTSYTDIVKSKVLLPLKSLIKQYAPNIQKDIDSIPDLQRIQVDNEIYSLSEIRRDINLEVGATPNIRVDKLKELGLKTPTTWAELYDVLKAFQKAYPDSIPWGCRGENTLLRSNLSPMWSLGACYNLYMDDKGSWKLGRMEDSYKNALTYLHKLYAEKLLDNEYLVKSTQDWKDGLGSGKYLFYYDNPVFLDSFNLNLKKVDPKARFEPIPILANDAGQRQNFRHPDNYFSYWGISSKVKNPELAIKFWNWLYSEQGGYVLNYGIEGQTYTMVNGKPTFKKELVDKYINGSKDPVYAVSSDVGLGNLFFTPAWYSRYADPFRTTSPDSVNTQFIYNVYAKNLDQIVKQPIEPPYTSEEAARIKTIKQSIDDYSKNEVNKFVTGARSLSEFDDFAKELKAKGADELVGIVNAAEARFVAQKAKR
jgi:ABC-type sugar transport system, periplasmic component